MAAKDQALEQLNKVLLENRKVQEEFFQRQSEDVVRVAELMGQCISAGGKLLLCGNGGSATDSLHFSGEMIGRFLKERRPLPAISLAGDISAVTAIGNDYGYDMIFARGVEAFGRPGDILFAISTSGKSPNVLKAAQAAKKIGVKIVALTGGTGGPLAELADEHLCVKMGKTSAAIQEVHIQVIHLLVGLMDEYFLTA
ncbi:MAG: SIS domain-containing protein [Proteobacteria bacterium]|nr:MAG: SIS domain-containing protein [Pseudomonadota bacterium]